MKNRWPKIWFAATICLVGIFIFGEFWVRALGYHPSIRDDYALWAMQRSQLEDNGNANIIFVGASRSLYGIDPEQAEAELENVQAVQLSIRGGGLLPVFESLAGRYLRRWLGGRTAPHIVVASVEGPSLEFIAEAKSNLFVNYHRYRWREALGIERQIVCFFEENIALLQLTSEPRSLVVNTLQGKLPSLRDASLTQGNRSISAPKAKLIRSLEGEYGKKRIDVYRENRQAHHLSEGLWAQQLDRVAKATSQLEKIGVRVVFVRFPSSGDYRNIERQLYPRKAYWNKLDELCKMLGCITIHYEDEQNLQNFETPDGSHLAGEDKTEFTRELMKVVKRKLLASRTI